ncbi:MAG: GNAT family N-acetyltransferase [Boseongicola sp. SB0676_bin_33]|uniref:GNAT family N-acetyltransferase n=1 Tax=Boseongicola sp. SB0664_bin_43 TaxID=2604844 RepID=A0A6B0XVS7_9RHOB|nr:GNAT family N-acetyltransferase [Boseongicola sp. SB0664_bin_43]MYF89866.1 GNAT family N-acetyltransferase [Boseongicola sp. SB0676_bin_33]
MEVPGPWSAREFADLLASPGVFLAVPAPERRAPRGQDSEATTRHFHGFALGRVAADEAELLTVAVDPGHRRQGIGLACCAAFESEAGSRGAARAFLEVAATNDAARRLYLASGWIKDGRRQAYCRTPAGRVDAILMSKWLARS